MTELALIRAAQAGDSRAADIVIRRYVGLAYTIADRYFFPGADSEDVRQESLIGLLRALHNFDGSGSFHGFAAFCVDRQLSARLRQHQAKKHSFLTHATRVTRLEDETVDAVDNVACPRGRDPLLVLVDNERIRDLIDGVNALSPFEHRCVVGYLNGKTYTEIGPFKKVDNALHRARKKLAA